MATIKDLFKQKENDLYGTTDMIRIETHGLVNIPRGAALLASSPDTIGDLIGTQVVGIIKGTANRPSDTIFRNDGFFAKPISLGQTQVGLQRAADDIGSAFVKEHPAPASLIAKIKQGGSSPAGVATNVAISTLNKFGSKKGHSRTGGSLLGQSLGIGLQDKQDAYGVKYGRSGIGNKPNPTDKKFSDYREVWAINSSEKPRYTDDGYSDKTLSKRNKDGNWDNANNEINKTTDLKKWKEQHSGTDLNDKYKLANQIMVTFQKYGNTAVVPFVGTISGISEDITPEWSDLKYIGSPFKVHRYGGVSRSLKFELKLYYTNSVEREAMIKKINYLKSLAFPYDNISTIKVGESASQYAFAPNLVYLTIGDLYKNMFGFIDTLSFSIDDNTAWSNFNVNADDSTSNMLYPSVITVSTGLKIIENHGTNTTTGITQYKYDFDGLNPSEYYTIADGDDKSQKIKSLVAVSSEVTSNLPNSANQLQVSKPASTPAYTTSPEGFNSDSKYLSVGNRTFK